MSHDIAIIGAGIAGASVAAELAGGHRVLVLEAEPHAGYHATGRSAAFWHESYGGPAVQPLTTASKPLLDAAGVLAPRGSLYVAAGGSVDLLDKLSAAFTGSGVVLDRLDAAGLAARLPQATDAIVGAVLESSCQDIDVATLHAGFIARARRGGVEVIANARIDGLWHDGTGWTMRAGDRTFRATTIVNAAGAWASSIAALAGAQPIAIAPLRRTIVQVRVDAPVPADLPLVIDIAGRFYFKPSGPEQLWLSPHDETPSAACDAAPDEYDVALAIDLFERVTTWRVSAVERKWAGLRSFAPDRLPVYGFDAQAPGFFWCAGQGGFGIQTSPAAGRLCAALLRGAVNPDGLDAAPFDPRRFA